MIQPTIGRVIWFHESKAGRAVGVQPKPALICRVWSDRMINVAGFDKNGDPFKQTSVRLVQEGDPIPNHGFFAEWMPYQQQQAKRYTPTLTEKMQERKNEQQ